MPAGPKSLSASERTQAAVNAALAYSAGLLMRNLPAYVRPGKHWAPTDWKLFARPLLGVYAVAQLNKALNNWQPPPWFLGVETMTAITPLMSGVSRYGVGQWVVHAPLIGALVQAAHQINQTVGKTLQADYGVPMLISKLVTGGVLATAGYKAIPPLTKKLLTTPFAKRLFPPPKEMGMGGALAGAMTTCARGCTPGGILCMSELSELLGSLGHWAGGRDQRARAGKNSANTSAGSVRFGKKGESPDVEALPAPTAEDLELMKALEQDLVQHYQNSHAHENNNGTSTCCHPTTASPNPQGPSCCDVKPIQKGKELLSSWTTDRNPVKRFIGRVLSWIYHVGQSVKADFQRLVQPNTITSMP